MMLKCPSALHIRPDDVLLVSDLDLQRSVIALRLSMNCVSIAATVTGQIKNIPQVFGICSTVEAVYVASSHPQKGGIFMFEYRYMYLKKARYLKTYIDTNSSIDFEKLH